MKKRGRDQLADLLQQRTEHPDRAPGIDALIRQTFGVLKAVMAMDMSGFSRQTIKHGIIEFLALIHRTSGIARPVIAAHGGRLLKVEADNAFAVFDTVDAAVAAAVDILDGVSGANAVLRGDLDMAAMFGIGYGEILLIGDADLYGSEVNLASKLGEDIAQRGEILLTDAAFRQARSKAHAYEDLPLSVSGVELLVHKVKSRPARG